MKWKMAKQISFLFRKPNARLLNYIAHAVARELGEKKSR